MGEAFVELIFWVVVFVAFFFGFKKLQKRKEEIRARQEKNTAASEAGTQDD